MRNIEINAAFDSGNIEVRTVKGAAAQLTTSGRTGPRMRSRRGLMGLVRC